jgi:hypothetical protein
MCLRSSTLSTRLRSRPASYYRIETGCWNERKGKCLLNTRDNAVNRSVKVVFNNQVATVTCSMQCSLIADRCYLSTTAQRPPKYWNTAIVRLEWSHLRLGVSRARRSTRSCTPGATLSPRMCTRKICSRSSRRGRSQEIWRSNRPGRNSACHACGDSVRQFTRKHSASAQVYLVEEVGTVC